VFTLDGRPARRMVLGDWYEQGSVLGVDSQGWRLEGLPLEKPAKTKKMKVKS
jgi:UDP-2,3-diacylglucosamine hydrolase